MRNRTSDLWIPHSDALPQSHRDQMWARPITKFVYDIFLYFFTELKAYHLSYSINNHDAIDIADPNSMNGCLPYATRVLSHHARDKTKNIFLRN